MAGHIPIGRTVPAVLAEMALARGANPAVIGDGRIISYAELFARAQRVAQALRSLAVLPGERIGVLVNNRLEWLEICLGTQIVGATPVPISTWSKPREISFILRDSGARILFAVPSFGKEDFVAGIATLANGDGPGLEHCILIGAAADGVPAQWQSYEALLGKAADQSADIEAQPQQDALVLYTSGSTSTPKAVRLAHYGLIENGFAIGERMALTAQDRVHVSVPLFWAYGAANALPAIFTHGATMVLQDRFEPTEALTLIERHRCTAIYTLPPMTAALIADPSFAPERTRSLRTGLTTGAPQEIRSAALDLGAGQICNVYGSSETYGNCCVTPSDWPLERRAACQGPPLPRVSVRIIDAVSGVLACAGEPGLIEVTGYLMPGYGGSSAALNADVFTGDGWYRTGDIGTLTDAGEIVFLGRQSELIKRAGINVSPAEVEDVLMQHPHVAQAAVVGVPDARRGEIIVASVVPRPGTSPGEADLLEHCRNLASTYKVPDRILFRESLPTTATGKLMRTALKNEAVAAMTALVGVLQGRDHDA